MPFPTPDRDPCRTQEEEEHCAQNGDRDSAAKHPRDNVPDVLSHLWPPTARGFKLPKATLAHSVHPLTRRVKPKRNGLVSLLILEGSPSPFCCTPSGQSVLPELSMRRP